MEERKQSQIKLLPLPNRSIYFLRFLYFDSSPASDEELVSMSLLSDVLFKAPVFRKARVLISSVGNNIDARIDPNLDGRAGSDTCDKRTRNATSKDRWTS